MKDNLFQTQIPLVRDNPLIRKPQQESYEQLAAYARSLNQTDLEVGIVLPVGCGKSGCIALAPFVFRSKRTLVVAPNVNIAKQLYEIFNPSSPNMFYTKCNVLKSTIYPEPVEIRGNTTNLSDLNEADVVITNIQQLQGPENRWLQALADDFFDLILFDEGHHNVAESWTTLKEKFPKARVVNFSATPLRSDGKIMAGRILYSFPVYQAIQEGYVKQLKAIVLNPKTLRYIRKEDDQEIEVDLDEVRRLGEEDSSFRRSIVTSAETLNTIVDASIRELRKLRESTGEQRLKIIASALNRQHCIQIVEAYRERGLNADYVHSLEEGTANQRVMRKLDNHALDVIIQVRKLGEGFDHPFLAVAAVFSIFSNLSPFVQFVGRIMRVIKQDSPGDKLNRGTVIFHAGSNIASRWADFQNFSKADQEYFDTLLPMQELNFSSVDELEIVPEVKELNENTTYTISSQASVQLEVIPLIKEDTEAMNALKLLLAKGYTVEQLIPVYEELERIHVPKAKRRQAKRFSLNLRIKTEVSQILSARSLSHEGKELDKKRLNKSNFIIVKSAIDRHVNKHVNRGSNDRHNFNKEDLESIENSFSEIVMAAIKEVFND
ncbi:MAG: DEAD/DEAH box helicase [Candidatus Berkiella sp.]